MATLDFLGRSLPEGGSTTETVTAWIIVSTVALVVIAAASRAASLPAPVFGYGVAAVAFVVLVDGTMSSKVRLLLPAVPLLIPIAAFIARRRWWTQLAVVTLTVAFGTWFSAYALTDWGYAI